MQHPTSNDKKDTPINPFKPLLEESEWLALEQEHHRLLDPLISAYQQRRQQCSKQPVIDFLFEYYQNNRGKLANWRPGLLTALKGKSASRFLKDPRYSCHSGTVFLDRSHMDSRLTDRVKWVIELLESASKREAKFNCFGLHEWAMLYKCDNIRHKQTPLRVSSEQIEAVVESHSIRCSHYDAYRFFTTDAKPRNNIAPSRENRDDYEQFGCVHFNMDLYKWCYKFAPWTSSELTRRCFFHAVRAREIDMRMSPYDVKHLGLEPIPIETEAGKKAFQFLQQQLFKEGIRLQKSLLKELYSIKNEEFTS